MPRSSQPTKPLQKEHWTGDPARTEALQKHHSAGLIPMLALHNKMGVFRESGEKLCLEDITPEGTAEGLLLYVDEFLSDEECTKMRAAVDAAGLNPANKADLHPKKNEAFLNRDNLTYHDPLLSETLWSRLAPLLNDFEGRSPVGFNPSLRYYRYTKGHRFDQHVDVAVQLDNLVSEYTLLLYLNGVSDGEDGEEVLQGGSTVFYKTAKSVLMEFAPKKGALLLHAHGPRCLMHEGAEVTKGVKYVFRTDLMYPKKGAGGGGGGGGGTPDVDPKKKSKR